MRPIREIRPHRHLHVQTVRVLWTPTALRHQSDLLRAAHPIRTTKTPLAKRANYMRPLEPYQHQLTMRHSKPRKTSRESTTGAGVMRQSDRQSSNVTVIPTFLPIAGEKQYLCKRAESVQRWMRGHTHPVGSLCVPCSRWRTGIAAKAVCKGGRSTVEIFGLITHLTTARDT